MPRRRVRRAPPAVRPAGGPPRNARSGWLGSGRLAAWANQTLVSGEAYAPFGGAYAGAGAGEQMFTGKGQRLAAGIYDFPFRHYSPAQGRWLSPDPSGLAAVNPANPQSWNAYAYVANQPLTAADPLGLNGNGSTGCGVGQPADGPCPVVTFTVYAYAYPLIYAGTFTMNVYAGSPAPPDFVNADLTGVPYCAAHPISCMAAGLGQHSNGPGPSGSWNNGDGAVAAAMAAPQTPTPTPQQKQAACQAQYQQGISDARSALKTRFLAFFTAVGIPGDLGLIGCLGAGEFAPACMEGVELALGGPSILGTFAFVHQYNTAVDAAKSQLQACQGRP